MDVSHYKATLYKSATYHALANKQTTSPQPLPNINPDPTGSPKFLSKKVDVPLIADQILTDTRGYTSKDWNRFLYVIYETNRFRTEKDWNLFLEQSSVPKNTTVVVLNRLPMI